MQSQATSELNEASEQDTMEDFDRCNLIVNYLPHEIDDGILKVLFSQHGDIVMAKVVKDKLTKRSLGFGFVKYADEASAAEAIAKKGGMVLGRKQLKVSYARPSSDDIRNCKLYVTNLPRDYSDREVLALFQQFGDIIECRVLKQTNSPGYKGVAFIQYDLRSQAESALSLNGYMIPNHNRPISVKFAENQHKKKDRRMQQGFQGGRPNNNNNNAAFGVPNNGRDDRVGMNVDGTNSFYYQQAQLSPLYANALSASMPMVTNSVNNSMYYGNPMTSYQSIKSEGTMSDATAWYGQMGAMTYVQQQAMPYAATTATAPGAGPMAYDAMNMDGSNVAMGNNNMNNKPRDNGSVTLIVNNLPSYADLNYLHKIFSGYGRILSAQLEVNPNVASSGVSKGGAANTCAGRGKVQLASLAEAKLAINALNGVLVDNLPLQITIGYGAMHNKK